MAKQQKFSSSFAERIAKSLRQAIDFERGIQNGCRRHKVVIKPVPYFSPREIKDIRHSLNLTQESFAQVMGVKKKTVEKWESGKNSPMGPACRLLGILKTDHEYARQLIKSTY